MYVQNLIKIFKIKCVKSLSIVMLGFLTVNSSIGLGVVGSTLLLTPASAEAAGDYKICKYVDSYVYTVLKYKEVYYAKLPKSIDYKCKEIAIIFWRPASGVTVKKFLSYASSKTKKCNATNSSCYGLDVAEVRKESGVDPFLTSGQKRVSSTYDIVVEAPDEP